MFIVIYLPPVDNPVEIPTESFGESTRRNVTNDVNFVPFFLCVKELLRQPLQLAGWVSIIDQQPTEISEGNYKFKPT